MTTMKSAFEDYAGEGENGQPPVDQATVLIGVTLAVVVLSLVFVSLLPSAQDFMFGNSLWNGTTEFSDRYSATEIHSFDLVPREPSREALVSIPQLPFTEAELERLREFASSGGTLLLLDDIGYGNQILEYLGLAVRFSGRPLADPLFSYRNPALARITDFSPEVSAIGVRSLLFNHGTVLVDVADESAFAWSSTESFIDDGSKKPDGTPLLQGSFPVAARYPLGKGEVIVVADSSIIINSMLTKDDNSAFLARALLGNFAPGDVLIDYSHLEKRPLDEAKRSLDRVRRAFEQPQYSLPALLLIFAAVYRYFLWPRRRSRTETPER